MSYYALQGQPASLMTDLFGNNPAQYASPAANSPAAQNQAIIATEQSSPIGQAFDNAAYGAQQDVQNLFDTLNANDPTSPTYRGPPSIFTTLNPDQWDPTSPTYNPNNLISQLTNGTGIGALLVIGGLIFVAVKVAPKIGPAMRRRRHG